MTKEHSIAIEEYLFGGTEETSDVDFLIISGRASLLSRIEGLHEDELTDTIVTDAEFVAAYEIHPAIIDIDNISYKKVRITTPRNKTISVVRIDMGFTGNARSFRWRIPIAFPDFIPEYHDVNSDIQSRMKFYWSVVAGTSPNPDSTLILYAEIDENPDHDTMVSVAQKTGRTISYINRILGHMQILASEWNASISVLASEYLEQRRQDVTEREKFLSEFKQCVNFMLLAPPEKSDNQSKNITKVIESAENLTTNQFTNAINDVSEHNHNISVGHLPNDTDLFDDVFPDIEIT